MQRGAAPHGAGTVGIIDTSSADAYEAILTETARVCISSRYRWRVRVEALWVERDECDS